MNQTHEQKKKPPESTAKARLRSIPIKSIFLPQNLGLVGLFIVILYLISPPLKLPWIRQKEGEYANETILAEVRFEVTNLEATRLAKERAASLSPPVYVIDPEIAHSAILNAQEHFDKLSGDILNPVFTPEERVALISKYVPNSVSQETLGLLVTLDGATLDSLRSASVMTIQELLDSGILGDVPGSAKLITISDAEGSNTRVVEVDQIVTMKTAPERIATVSQRVLPGSPELQRAFTELTVPFIRSTLTFDNLLTRDAQEKAREDTPDVSTVFSKNQEILQAGHKVTEQDILELEAHGRALAAANRFQVYIGNALILASVFCLFLLYLRRFRPDVLKNNKGIWLIGILAFITLAGGRVALALPNPNLWLYVVPVAAGAILLSILVDDRMALVYSFFISVFYAAQGNYNLSLFLIALFGSLAGIFCIRTIRQRSDIFWPGIVVAVVNVVTILALNLIGVIDEELQWAILAGALNGLIAAIAVVPGALIPLESLFGIATNIRLLELSDLNHPLLKRMAMEAPGTFHHCLMVGNMAEYAAEQMGANSLLARVGSYYHDVGKMKKPLYFSENQRGGKNRHDELTPSMSALVLTSHVKEGIELAREYRLNQPILDFIKQHHGTSLMTFFYQKALEQDSTQAVKEENFRYNGPKPQTRETAICMLADSVEAASRTLTDPTHGRIKALVEKIVNNKFVDSQLDECDLTLKDLHKIADSFVRALAGYLHSRVEYPEEQTIPEIKEKFEGTDTKVGQKARSKNRADSRSH